MTVVVFAGPDGNLAAEVSVRGSGLPVVFIHSDGGTRGHWLSALQHVAAKGRPAAALDLRGHGGSDPPRSGDMSYAGRAADIRALLDHLGWERVVLVGHSGGALAALTFAVFDPARVASLLLVDPGSDPASIPAEQREAMLAGLRGEGYEAMVTGYYASIAGPDEAVRKQVLDDLKATPKATLVGTFEALNSFVPASLLSAWRGPTLVVAARDHDSPAALHRLGVGLPFRLVEGTGHWLHLDAPEQFHAILDEVVAKAAEESQRQG